MRESIWLSSAWLILLCPCTTSLVGCGEAAPELVTVRGRVLYEGTGVTAGSLYFHPNADAGYTRDNPSSMLQSDGSFAMKTFPFGEGVAPGSYKVTLTPELASRLKAPEYGVLEQTPWEVIVPAEGVENLTLVITP